MKQYVELSFLGINPEEVTTLLGISATEARKAGSERAPGKTWTHNSWALRPSTPQSEIDTAKHFAELFKELAPHLAAIRVLAKRVKPTVSWVVQVFADEQTPNGQIPYEIVGAIQELGADLNVSLYFDRANIA